MTKVFNVTALLPRKYANAPDIKGIILKAQMDAANASIIQLEKTVSTWKDKPVFIKKMSRGSVLVTTNIRQAAGKHFLWTDLGTKPHKIRAKNAPFLVFRWGGTPKSKPLSLRAMKGKAGKNWAKKLEVNHPGTKPRLFLQTVGKQQGKAYQRNLKIAIAKKMRGG